MRRSLLFCPVCLTLLCLAACSDEAPCSTDGIEEKDGPRCCAGGCGLGTDGWLPRICEDGQWVCQGSGVIEFACASPTNACNTMEGCLEVGVGKEEPDPAPELCCMGGCEGTQAVHRVCKTGTTWQCPSNSVPVSTCKDFDSACGEILLRYRENQFRLPD